MTHFDVEEAILMLADIVQERRFLEEENFKLKTKLKEYDKMLDETYNQTVNLTGVFMDAVVNGCIKPKEK